MASLGKIQIVQPLRKVKFVRNGIEGWFHGFFQEKENVIALVEMNSGRMVKEHPTEIVFLKTPDSDEEAESELVDEARLWDRNGKLQRQWMSIAEKEREALCRCVRCGTYAHRNKDLICLACWKKLKGALEGPLPSPPQMSTFGEGEKR